MSYQRTLLVTVASIMMFASLAYMHSPATAATGKVDVWWPTNGAHVTGTQPFKAMLENTDVQNYQMFWQVDGGQWNWMDSNWADYQHKEASVNLSGWNWKGSGPYQINFIARDPNGTIVAQQSENIYIDSGTVGTTQTPAATTTPIPTVSGTPTPSASPTPTPAVVVATSTPTPSATPKVSATPTPVSTPVATLASTATPTPQVQSVSISTSGNPLANATLYVNPYSDPAQWVKNNSSSSDAPAMAKIANQAESEWFGDWNSNVYQDAKSTTNTVTATGATPVYVIYDIPHRDCGSYSAGGASSAAAYTSWINSLVSGIGGKKAVALLEPDALAGMDCLSATDQAERTALIKRTVTTLESHNIAVYIDAGNPHWISVDDMANRLKAAGIDQAHGFALNISNFFTTGDNTAYGTDLSAKLGGKHFVIDTSRNGSGPSSDYQWCNPTGRSLGQKPTTNTGNPLIDAFLWVKGPGGSDGACGNGAPSAGQFWSSYAIDLAKRTNW